ncbi:MAG: hypothetical protein LBE59_05420 [Nevskiaceae bacterium]|jgi:hypothetical protein|nr:hypothetical protein [Nevskiaceae bacterium]
MVKRISITTVAASLLCSITGSALAHHGISNWDLNKDVTVTGKLTKMELINPHAWIYVDVTGPDGKVTPWRCEMRSANALRRSGWTADMFKVGTTITVTGSPERKKANYCYLSTIMFADGSQMDRYGQRQLAVASTAKPSAPRTARLPSGVPNLGGDWAAEQRVMSDPRGQLGTLVPLSDAAKMKPGDLPAGGQPFPGARGSAASLSSDPVAAAWARATPVKLTAKGEQARSTFNPATRQNPRLRCEPTNIVFDWGFDSVVNRVTQTPTLIRMQYGHMDLQREIHLDGKPAPAATKPSLAGYSVGRWEGDTLVVVTDHFAPGVLNADAYMLHGAQLKITERFTLDATGTKLTRSYVAEDPEYLAEAWRGQDVVLVADVPFEPYSCLDPGGAPGE